VLAVLVPMGCSGDDDGVADDGLTEKEAASAVDRALLETDDLGDGWDDTGTVAPDEQPDPPDPVEACIGASTLRVLDDATLARSERRDFERDGEGQFESTRVQVRTIAVKEGEAADPVLALFDDDGFVDCFAGQLEPQISDEPSELRLDVGDADVDDAYLALDGVESARLAIPFHTSAPGFDFDAELDLVVVHRDQLVSFLVTIEVQGRVDGEDVARWSALLADRQRIAQSDTDG
jgi:hypothetical protein